MTCNFPFDVRAFYRNQPVVAWIMALFTVYLIYRAFIALTIGATPLEYALAGAIIVAVPWCVWSYRAQSAVSIANGILTFRDRPGGRRTRIHLEDVAVVRHERSRAVDIRLRNGGVRTMSAAWLAEAHADTVLAVLREHADPEDPPEAD